MRVDSVSSPRPPSRRLRHPMPIGKRFGRLVVESEPFMLFYAGKERPFVECRCDCGTELNVLCANLNVGNSTSCGCRRFEAFQKSATRHGESYTRLYRTWRSMRQRCSNPNHADYGNYGGRGIAVCSEWENYETFRDWAIRNGYDNRLTIERKNTDGNYEPGNCCWITQAKQCQNMRTSVFVTAWGETKCAAEWARDPRCRVHRETILRRVKHGKRGEECLL